MRGDEVVIDPRSRSSTYAILGDSVVYGSGIDQSETVTWQLRQSLAGTRSGAATQPQVLNIAASSWGPENILRFYERFGPFPGDTAWIVQSTHDMTDVLHQKHELVPYRTSAPLGALHDIIVAVARQYVPTLWGVAPETRTEAAMRAEADAALVALMARLREDYARVVLVFHATRDEALQNAPSGELHFKEHAARAGVDFLSTTEAYRRAYESGDPPHYDSIHLSKSGALLLSRLLQSSLAPAKQ